MTDSSAVAATPVLTSHDNWPWRIAVVAILTALADWLFFRQDVGVSLALFVFALGAAVLAANQPDASRRDYPLWRHSRRRPSAQLSKISTSCPC